MSIEHREVPDTDVQVHLAGGQVIRIQSLQALLAMLVLSLGFMVWDKFNSLQQQVADISQDQSESIRNLSDKVNTLTNALDTATKQQTEASKSLDERLDKVETRLDALERRRK